MADNMIFLGEFGELYPSRYYFDKENNCFMEETSYPDYHDDWHYEKPSVISAQQVYDDFVSYMYTEGIEKMLEYCDEEQIEKTSDKGITEEEFRKKLSGIEEFPLWRMKNFGSTYILYDKQGNILCAVFETKYFYAYVSSRLLGGSSGFKTLNEAFSYAVRQVNEYYINLNIKEEVRPKPEEKKTATERKKPELTENTKKLIKFRNICAIVMLVSFCAFLGIGILGSTATGHFDSFVTVFGLCALIFLVSLAVLIVSSVIVFFKK